MHILGCGAALPLPGRNPTAQVVNVHEKQFLLDCGEGTQHQFLRSELRLSQLRRIFVTHMHGDHVFGLPGLLASLGLAATAISAVCCGLIVALPLLMNGNDLDDD